jgi:hypothetical protein
MAPSIVVATSAFSITPAAVMASSIDVFMVSIPTSTAMLGVTASVTFAFGVTAAVAIAAAVATTSLASIVTIAVDMSVAIVVSYVTFLT